MTERSVLVTGASTGIGRASVIHLARNGLRVFAGVRKREDADALSAEHERITPIMLDVTDAASIDSAHSTVLGAAEGVGLFGLVNNAGIAVAGPLEFLPLDDLRRQFEVNVLGQVAVTQAFLPVLREARGRVVNMSSISGRLASPFLAPYAMSKFALEAFSDSLRRELHPHGVDVVCIEPGAIATPIWNKSLKDVDEREERMPAGAKELYGRALDAIRKGAVRSSEEAVPAEEVAAVVHEALTAPRPKPRYVVGRQARIGVKLAWLLPDRWLDRLLRDRFR